MATIELSREDKRAAELIHQADIVVGVSSYNNARTIGHVVRAICTGLAKYYPQLTGVIVNSDGGSVDKTRDEVLSARVESSQVLFVPTPLSPLHRLSLPYHGLPGKGSALRLIFKIAAELQAKACAVVDADLRSITPEWIDLLIRPVLFAGYDFVAPYYHRHKYDGTITNSIVYPLTRSLYGIQLRQSIGGEFGFSPRLVSRYLRRDDWETDIAGFGIDIWMTTIAVAEGFRVCQSFLGAKVHDAKDPSSDLSLMLQQVTGSVFTLMQAYEAVWQSRTASRAAELFGFRFDVGLDPIEVETQRMLKTFGNGCRDLPDIWALSLQPETHKAVMDLSRQLCTGAQRFRLSDELWARVILDFCCAYRRNPLTKGQILGSLTPLYLARVASFVEETLTLIANDVEEKIEGLCLQFERLKPYLIAQWNGESTQVAGSEPVLPVDRRPQERAGMEV
jgi:hypothetical protein